MPLARATYPKAARILRRPEFTRLSAGRPGFSGPAFLVVWLANQCGQPRLGVTASRKVGGAVVRNRIKRHVREYFRQHGSMLPPVDFNVIVRRRAAEMDSDALRMELQRAFQQIGLQ